MIIARSMVGVSVRRKGISNPDHPVFYSNGSLAASETGLLKIGLKTKEGMNSSLTAFHPSFNSIP